MNRRRLATAGAGLAALAVFVSCGEAPEPVPPRPTSTPESVTTRAPGARSVIDMMGRTVSVPDAVRTVAAMSPSAADFAVVLGLEVVGRSTDTPASVAPNAKPTGSTTSPDFNAIAALQPDLVLADAAFHSGRAGDFDRFAYPVFVLKANSYAEVLSALTALGAAAGRPEAAATARETIESFANRAVQSARARSASGPAPKVLILTGGGRDVFAGGAGSYLGNLAELLGGSNVLAAAAGGGPVTGFGVVDVGQAAALNPDVVFILSSGQGGLAARLRSDPIWANTPAVRRARIHDLDTTLYLRSPGPRVAEALDALLPLLWPGY